LGTYNIENEHDLEEIYLCESISGDLVFDTQEWLTGIDLPCLTSVGGNLYIGLNDTLTSIDGLSSVTSVGGYLYISHNDALTSLDGLSSLTSVGETLYIGYNDALCQDDAEALAESIEVSGTVTVWANLGVCE
jgi:hypothetical protein